MVPNEDLLGMAGPSAMGPAGQLGRSLLRTRFRDLALETWAVVLSAGRQGVSREHHTFQAGRAFSVMGGLVPQIDVFLSLVSRRPLVTAAAL